MMAESTLDVANLHEAVLPVSGCSVLKRPVTLPDANPCVAVIVHLPIHFGTIIGPSSVSAPVSPPGSRVRAVRASLGGPPADAGCLRCKGVGHRLRDRREEQPRRID